MPNAGVATVVPRRSTTLSPAATGLDYFTVLGTGTSLQGARAVLAGVRARPAGQLAMLGSAGGFAHEGLTATQEQENLAQQALRYSKIVT
ncbi:TPA: hypothetical protein ACH3X1_014049 [Trebouxia sp. C0004]